MTHSDIPDFPASELPHVMVLLAVYNGAAFLAEQIDSILKQTGVKVSLVISLDSCTDDSPEICAAYAARDGVVTLLPQGGRFGNAAYNFFYLMKMADLADTTHVAFADQDDIWLPEKLSRAVARMADSGADGYSCNLTAFRTETGEQWTIRKPGPARERDYLFQGASAGCTYVVTRKAADILQHQMRTSPIHAMPRPSHDWTFYAIIRSFGLAWVFDDGYSGILYRQHAGNFYGAGNRWDNLKKKLRIIRSGWFRTQIVYLGGVIKRDAEEVRIIDAVSRRSFADRLWLLARVGQFRREPRQRLALAGLIILGLI